MNNGDRKVKDLTKREFFAGVALLGLLACPDTDGSISSFAREALRHANKLLDEMKDFEGEDEGGV